MVVLRANVVGTAAARHIATLCSPATIGSVGLALGILFGIAMLLVAIVAGVLRWGLAFPRLGRWLDRRLGISWFSDPR